ncbi:Predicted phosphoesterase [Chitinophaga jiangningensis]|uniref:Predicted phosphoesterase n=1 Tax=Chitinophaga jiangningensis TaxID=1419482 RepID=A0A1M7ATU1_9BACT|nr:metallophosphoesterase [Chitinophaga jiangningensis]SHL46077.1 Predicted phosphoesterase [Chitinophaga jiangningensis]
MAAGKIRIAAAGDLHVTSADKGQWIEFFKQVSAGADVLLLAGDLTDTGDESEAEILVAELKACTIPVVAVLGNHDYEKGRQKLIRQIIQEHNDIHILDGECTIIHQVGFAGIKGFGGGFDGHMLSMFGEAEMKAFVQTGVNEALLLDRALARLDQEHPDIPKIALMHYSPSIDTVRGEPEQIYPFLGCSRLAEPIMRRKVAAVVHGHAHMGAFEGSLGNVKVYNVAKHVLHTTGNITGFHLLNI